MGKWIQFLIGKVKNLIQIEKEENFVFIKISQKADRSLNKETGFLVIQLLRSSLIILLSGTAACVGPTTPFGGLDQVVEVEKEEMPATSQTSPYKISFHPQAQVLHDRADFSVEINATRPLPDDLNLQITHNGIDVSETFLENSNVHKSTDNKTRIYLIKDLRLKTLDTNDINIRVLDSANITMASDQYKSPECSLFSGDRLAHLGSFHAPTSYIDMIERVAGESDVNPSFLAGIVAQESGFDPKAVSWAKAIGLTQITPLAESQVIKSVNNWPRYPGINGLSYLTLKSKIFLGEIDKEKEWRLNPEKSLFGGLTYVLYLEKYWNLEAHQKLVSELRGNRDQIMTELILASYNSGAARVKKAVQEKRNDWKKHQSLTEAVNYLKRVSSYCFHYTKKEVENDNET